MPSQPENLLYEYAVIRYVPRVERGEFFNIGLVMMCKRRRWIKISVRICDKKFEAFDNAFSRDTLDHQLSSFIAVAEGNKQSGSLAEMPVEERFRWITAVKSACIQTSRPHPGLCNDLDETFERLFRELVE